MTTHRFAVHVPNPGAKSQKAALTLEAVRASDLKNLRLGLTGKPLKIVRAFIAREACSEEGSPELGVSLDAFASVDVHVTIETAGGTPGFAAFNLVDRRSDGQEGGVMLVCTNQPAPPPGGAMVPTPNPCPVTVAEIYPVAPDGDVSKPSQRRTIAWGKSADLVVALINPTRRALSGVTAYLEHLGLSDASFAPKLWQIGEMAPGVTFFASWRVNAGGRFQGHTSGSVVAQSDGCDPTRLVVRCSFRGE